MERLPALAADLARLRVDVIVTGNNANVVAAMNATKTIPIVMTNSFSPVSAGLITGLARPGGNVTGLTADTGDEINGKRLEMLKDAIPALSRVAILLNPDFAPNQGRFKSAQEATQALGMTLVSIEARGQEAVGQAFAAMARENVQAFVVAGDPVLFNFRDQIGTIALKSQLPGASNSRDYTDAGLLLSYGVDNRDLWRRSAIFVDKIFKGAKPGELPVEQPIKFELVINLKTARALGVHVPLRLQQIADEVLE
jgi:putative ABC transport system substrate-binding protein